MRDSYSQPLHPFLSLRRGKRSALLTDGPLRWAASLSTLCASFPYTYVNGIKHWVQGSEVGSCGTFIYQAQKHKPVARFRAHMANKRGQRHPSQRLAMLVVVVQLKKKMHDCVCEQGSEDSGQVCHEKILSTAEYKQHIWIRPLNTDQQKDAVSTDKQNRCCY